MIANLLKSKNMDAQELVQRCGSGITQFNDENLQGVHLHRVNLESTRFAGADFTGAHFNRVNLRNADLRNANLEGALFVECALPWANFYRASAERVKFIDCNLRDTQFSDAKLQNSLFQGVDLRHSNFSEANLERGSIKGSNLRGITLWRTLLEGCWIEDIWNDLKLVLLEAVPEIEAIEKAIIEGRIDGSTYEGSCRCLNGTLHDSAVSFNRNDIANSIMLARDSDRPIERFVKCIFIGDTPENSWHANQLLQQVRAFKKAVGR